MGTKSKETAMLERCRRRLRFRAMLSVSGLVPQPGIGDGSLDRGVQSGTRIVERGDGDDREPFVSGSQCDFDRRGVTMAVASLAMGLPAFCCPLLVGNLFSCDGRSCCRCGAATT